MELPPDIISFGTVPATLVDCEWSGATCWLGVPYLDGFKCKHTFRSPQQSISAICSISRNADGHLVFVIAADNGLTTVPQSSPYLVSLQKGRNNVAFRNIVTTVSFFLTCVEF